MRYLVFVLVLFLFLAGCDALNPKPATVVSCKDSDGENVNVKGTVTLELSDKTQRIKQDECAAPETVNEAICPKSGLEISTQKIVCPSGPCVEGVCTERSKTTIEKPAETKEQVTVISCVDSDGENSNTKGSVNLELSDGTKKTKEDECARDDTVAEAICSKDGKSISTRNIVCPAGPCNNGICTTREKKAVESGYDYSVPSSSGPKDYTEEAPALTLTSCSDSDTDDNQYTKGTVVLTLSDGSTKTEDDSCASGSMTREVKCSSQGTYISYRSRACTLGEECQDGVCAKIEFPS